MGWSVVDIGLTEKLKFLKAGLLCRLAVGLDADKKERRVDWKAVETFVSL